MVAETIRVGVAGAHGRLGRIACAAIAGAPGLTLVGGLVRTLPAASDGDLRLFDDLDAFYTLGMDVVLGFMFGVAFVLAFAPLQLRAPARRWLLTAIGAILIWVCVSVPLVLFHWRVYQIRSRPLVHCADEYPCFARCQPSLPS